MLRLLALIIVLGLLFFLWKHRHKAKLGFMIDFIFAILILIILLGVLLVLISPS